MIFYQYMILYSSIIKYNKNTVVFYLGIFIGIVAILSRYTIELRHIFGIFVGAITIYFLYTNTGTKINQKNSELESKLNSIQKINPKIKWIHKSSHMIEVIYDLKFIYKRNPDDFYNFIQMVDDFFKLKNNIINNNVDNGMDNVDVAKDIMKKVLNTMHSFIMVIPTNPDLDDMIREITDETEEYMQNEIVEMIEHIKRKEHEEGQINKYTKFPSFGPQSFDIFNNPKFDYY